MILQPGTKGAVAPDGFGKAKRAMPSVLARRTPVQRALRPAKGNALPNSQGSVQRRLRGQSRTCNAVSTSVESPATYSYNGDDEHAMSVERAARRKVHLSALIELKRLYRNSLRAKFLIDNVATPVYIPVKFPAALKETMNAREPGSSAAAESDESKSSREEELHELQEQESERQARAIETVAEMTLTLEQLKGSLRSLSKCMNVIMTEADRDQATEVCNKLLSQLKDRIELEMKCLTFSTEEAVEAAVEARTLKYYKRRASKEGQQAVSAAIVAGANFSASSLDIATPPPPATAMERVAQAEKVAEKFLVQRIKPALRRVRETEFGDLIKGSSTYLSGLWVRLNGGSDRLDSSVKDLGLPLPSSTLKDSELVISILSRQLEALEKKLQDASKARESKLRKAGLQGRVQMAVQLKMIDADVLALSRALAVLTMQLEMEYIYTSLEAEALDVFSGDNGRDPLPRDGSVTELELLAAEYFMMEEGLLVLVSALDAKSPLTGSLVADDILERLAVEIPDMRNRVGVNDQAVYGGSGITMTKLQMQKDEAVSKAQEAINFMTLGVRILASDISNASRLFMRAALGGTLKQREVAALRRTAKDVVLFIPFAIILIIPLTPLGHVLIFGFIQTYFPSLFPSCFTTQRQEIMVKYEELRRALIEAQMKAEAAEDEAELARAAAAVAMLTAPTTATLSSTSPSSSSDLPQEDNGPLGWLANYTGGLPGWGFSGKNSGGVSAQYLNALANDGSADKSADAQDRVRVLEQQVRQLGDRFRLGDGKKDGEGEEAEVEISTSAAITASSEVLASAKSSARSSSSSISVEAASSSQADKGGSSTHSSSSSNGSH